MTTAAITKPTRQEVLPPETSRKVAGSSTTITLEDLCKVAQSEIDAMSFKELDGFVDLGIRCIALNQASIIRARQAMRPALIRIHDMLSKRGTRNDLNDVPVITWTQFCFQRKSLGCQRTLEALLKVAGLKNPDKQPRFKTGESALLLADGKDYPVSTPVVVSHFHEKVNPNDDFKVDICYRKNDEIVTKTVPAAAVEKIKDRTPHYGVGDLVIFDDIEGGAEYRYEGKGNFVRTDTPSKAEAAKLAKEAKKREKDAAEAAAAAAKEKEKADRAAAKAEAAAKKAAANEKEKAKKVACPQCGYKKCQCVAIQEGLAKIRKIKAKKPQSARPLVSHKLGDKFFNFEKGEVEISIRTARSSQFDTLEEAEASATKVNQKYSLTEAAVV